MATVVAIIDPDANYVSHVEQTCTALGLGALVDDGSKSIIDFVRGATPDLVVLNLELPRGASSGFSEVNKLKRHAELRGIPIILTSTGAAPEALNRHGQSKTPADAYLAKPFAMDVLVGTIERLIGGIDPQAAQAAADAPPPIPGAAPAVSGEGPPPMPGQAPALPDAQSRSATSIRSRSGGEALEDLLAKARAEAGLPPRPKAGGADRVDMLRHELLVKETDLKTARALWADRSATLEELSERSDKTGRELDRTKKAREALVGQLTTAEDNIASLKADVEIGRERAERLEREKDALAQELEDAQDHHEHLRRELEEKLAQTAMNLESERDAHSSDNAVKSAEIEGLTADLERTRADLAETVTAGENAETRATEAIANLRGEVAELEVQYHNTTQSLNESVEHSEAVAAQLQSAREAKALADQQSKTRIAELEQQYSDLVSEKSLADDQLSTTRSTLEKKARDLSAARSRVTELESDLADSQSQATDLSMQLDQSESKVASITLELDEQQANYAELKGLKERIDADLSELKVRHDKKTGEAEQLAVDLNQEKSDRQKSDGDYQRTLTEMQARIDKTQTHLEDELQKSAELTQSLDSVRADLATTQDALAEEKAVHARDVEKKDEEISALEKNGEQLAAKMHEAERAAHQEQGRLTQLLDAATARGQELDGSLARTKAKLAETEQHVAESRDKIAELTGQLRRKEAEAQDLDEKLTDSQERVRLLTEQLGESKDAAEVLRAELSNEQEARARDIAERDDALVAHQQEAAQKVLALEARGEELAETLTGVRGDLEEKRSAISMLKSEVADAQQDLADERNARAQLKEGMGSLDDELEGEKGKTEALRDENRRLKGLMEKAQKERDELKRAASHSADEFKDRESTLSRDLEQLRKQQADMENRGAADSEQIRAERDAAQGERDEHKKALIRVKHKYNDLVAQAKELKAKLSDRQKRLADELAASKEEHARDRAHAKSEVSKLKDALKEASTGAAAAADEELIQLRAQVQEKEERVAKITGDATALREKLKKTKVDLESVRADAAAAAATPAAGDAYKGKYEDAVKKRAAEQQKFKERYAALSEDHKKVKEKLQKVMDRIKAAKEAKAAK